MPCLNSVRRCAVARALPFFCKYVLEHHLIEGQVRDQPFEFRILVLQLSKLPDLLRLEPGVPPLPPREGLFSDPEMTDQIGHWRSHLGLFEYGHDLLDTETLSFHSILLPLSRG